MSDPSGPRTSLERVWALIDLRRWPEALATAQKLVTQDPGSAPSWLALAVAASGGGRHDVALDAAQRAAGIDPTSPAAYRLLAVAQTHFPTHRRHAYRTARYAVALDPDDPISHRVLADVALVLERRGDAVRAVRRHLSLAPDSASGWVTAAEVQLGLGSVDLAEDSLLRALRIEPDHHGAVSLLGFVLACKGDLEGALRLHRSAIGSLPADADVRLLAGRSANRRTLFPIAVVLGAAVGMLFSVLGLPVGAYVGGYVVTAVDRRRGSRGQNPMLLPKQFAAQPGMGRAVLDYREALLRRRQAGPDIGFRTRTVVGIGIALLLFAGLMARREAWTLVGMTPLAATAFVVAGLRRWRARSITRLSTDPGA